MIHPRRGRPGGFNLKLSTSVERRKKLVMEEWHTDTDTDTYTQTQRDRHTHTHTDTDTNKDGGDFGFRCVFFGQTNVITLGFGPERPTPPQPHHVSLSVCMISSASSARAPHTTSRSVMSSPETRVSDVITRGPGGTVIRHKQDRPLEVYFFDADESISE